MHFGNSVASIFHVLVIWNPSVYISPTLVILFHFRLTLHRRMIEITVKWKASCLCLTRSDEPLPAERTIPKEMWLLLLILTRVQTVSKILAHPENISTDGKIKEKWKNFLQQNSTFFHLESYWYVLQLSDASAIRDQKIYNYLIALKIENSSWKSNLTPSKNKTHKTIKQRL